MANFDTNRYYQLVTGKGGTGGSGGQSMDGTSLYNQGKGAVFFQNTNTTDSGQQWQIFPFNSSVYVLRTQASGSEGYMGVALNQNEDTPGKTVPIMVSAVQADDSMFWNISPWGDGTFYFTNAANGTAWHLTVKSNSLMAMTSNISVQQDAQSFSFLQLGTIDDSSYSSVVLPASISASTSTSSTTSLPSSSATSSSSTTSPTKSAVSHSGLSTGASAAIGASIGGVALIAGLIFGFIMYKRRKRTSQVPLEAAPIPPKEFVVAPKEWPAREEAREMDVPPAELHGHQPSAELPGYWNRN